MIEFLAAHPPAGVALGVLIAAAITLALPERRA
jgi:hypothetical protein